MPVKIVSPFGHMKTDSWMLAKIIQLAVMDFCRQFLTRTNDPCGRQFDQTTQAARAVPANIAEGSSRHSTSTETEMRLLDVARASISEVLDDFMFFLLDRRQPIWPPDHQEATAIRSLRLLSCENTILSNVGNLVLKNRDLLSGWIDNKDIYIRANAIIVLCIRLIKILSNQMQNRLECFEAQGGFSEQMTHNRLEALTKNSKETGTPLCPNCNKPMRKRLIKRGSRQGNEFWGCIDYPRCTGTRELTETN